MKFPVAGLIPASTILRLEPGLRHTYISARVAECGDVPLVAEDAGNSPQVILTNYLEADEASCGGGMVFHLAGSQWAGEIPSKEYVILQATLANLIEDFMGGVSSVWHLGAPRRLAGQRK